MKNIIINTIISLIIIFILWYIILPPINLQSPLFWFFIILVTIITCIIFAINNKNNREKIEYILQGKKVFGGSTFVELKIAFCAILLIPIILLINLTQSPLFNAHKYATRITVDETSSFVQDVSLVDWAKVPLIDKDSSSKLGDRIMGQKAEWVSQYYVSDLYTQINYNDEIVRVTPIEYAGFIKYLSNRGEGIKGYITVNSVDGSAKLVTIDKGMRYMPSAYFFENLRRKLRISYPTLIFDEPSFEIDNEGNPYWIVPTIKYAGIGLRKEINGIVILNAVTGESKHYDIGSIPTWVDHVYPAELVIDQMNNWGEYKEGFVNSIFGQKNVVNTTEGYNYLVMDDDVFLYTGITSVSTDESNLGFVLINLRTKETKYYSAPGAEEFSAMASAEGLVQEKGYRASFPLLINLNNKPTYLLSLKDNAGLVKMYAFVDVADYQKVVVSDSSLGIEVAAAKYLGDAVSNIDPNKHEVKEIAVNNITNAVIDGNTYYFITDKDNNLYSASIKVNKDKLPFVKPGSTIKVTYSDGDVKTILKVD